MALHLPNRKIAEKSSRDDILTEEQIKESFREAYLVKFGNLYVRKKNAGTSEVEHCYRVRPLIVSPKKKGLSPFDIEKVINCFEKSPQIEDVKFARKGEIRWRGYHFDPMIRWHFNPSITMKLKLPVKNQPMTKAEIVDYGDFVETSSKFKILYDGSNYVITTKVKAISKFHASVFDVRDLLSTLLEKEFTVDSIPPNPIRHDYYLIFLPSKKDVKRTERIIKSSQLPRRYFLLATEDEKKQKDKLFQAMFSSSTLFLDVFFAGSMISQHLRKSYVELNVLHMDIQKKSKDYLSTPSRKLLTRGRIKSDLEELIRKHYEIALDQNICRTLIEDAKLVVKEKSEKAVPFHKTFDELIRVNYKYYPLNVDLFNTCLEYSKTIVERTFSWRLALYAAIFGATSSVLISYGPDIVDFLKDLFTQHA